MFKQSTQPRKRIKTSGFSLSETLVATAILGTLASITYPNLIASKGYAQCSEAKATLVSIPPIISAYIDETGEAPTKWEDLSSITAVMTSDGLANGKLAETAIILPRNNYELSIQVPNEGNSVYLLAANCYIKTPLDDPKNAGVINPIDKDKYVIRSCFDVSNGASDLTSGSGSDPANTPNCG